MRGIRVSILALMLASSACYQSTGPDDDTGTSAPAYDAPPVLFLNFGGGQFSGAARDDAVRNRSVIAADGPLAVSSFDATPGLGGDIATRGQVIADITRQVRAVFRPFDLEIVTRRPDSGPYSMVVVGGTLDEVLQMGRCVGGGVDMAAGIAPIDCGNARDLNVAFVAPACLPPSGPAAFRRLTAVATAHEAGHVFGLEHVESGSGSLMEIGASQLTWGRGRVIGTECGQTVQDDRDVLTANL